MLWPSERIAVNTETILKLSSLISDQTCWLCENVLPRFKELCFPTGTILNSVTFKPRPHRAREILKRHNHRSFWICVWGNLVQGNHDYRDVIVFEKPRFRIGLVWTVGLTVQIQLRFEISPRYCGRGPCYSFFLSLSSFFFWLTHVKKI